MWVECSSTRMADALHRIVDDATVDDAVDVAIRMSGKSRALQKQVRGMIVGTGILGGFAFTALWIAYTTTPALFDFAVALAGGIVFGIIFALVFRQFLRTTIRLGLVRTPRECGS